MPVLWHLLDQASVASWQLIEYVTGSATFLLPGVILVVSSMSWDTTCHDFVGLQPCELGCPLLL